MLGLRDSALCIQLYYLIFVFLSIKYANLLYSVFDHSFDIGFRVAVSLDSGERCWRNSGTFRLVIIHLGNVGIMRLVVLPM